MVLFKMCCFGGSLLGYERTLSTEETDCTALPPDAKSAGKRFSPVSSVHLKAKPQWPFVSPKQSTINSGVDGAGSCEKKW